MARGFIVVVFCLMLCGGIVGGISAGARAQTVSPNKARSQADLAKMPSDHLARYIFENHGCKNCHTLENNGKFGFTEQGKAVGKGFEGCISLLTSMNVIAQVKDENRTPEEKKKAVRFKEFGCTECHQIVPGKMGLTKEGAQLKSLHMSCPEVQKLLTSK